MIAHEPDHEGPRDHRQHPGGREQRIVGARLERVTLVNPFLLRTAVPPLTAAAGRRVERLRRVGKRIAIGLESELWLVIHLMIAGRLHWFAAGQKISGRAALA